MNIEELFNKPNYDGLNKKEKQRLLQKEFEKEQIANYIKENLLTEKENSIDLRTYNKYTKQGVLWNPKVYASGDLDRQLAEAQSNWDKFGNALAQTLVSEIVLGTLIGFSDLADFIGQNVFQISDNNYTNPLTDVLEKWQEEFRNATPIYSAPGSGFENGTDFGWWMQHLPSVASSLTLMLPTAGVGSAISKIGKLASKGVRAATKQGSKWIKYVDDLDEMGDIKYMMSPHTREVAGYLGRAGIEGATMRTLENYREARQVWKDKYNEINNLSNEEYNEFVELNKKLLKDVDITDRNAVSEAISEKAADCTFKADYANTIFDILQIAMLRGRLYKPFKPTRSTNKARQYNKQMAEHADDIDMNMDKVKDLVKGVTWKEKTLNATKNTLTTIGKGVAMQSLEGIEESINYIAQQEGMLIGKDLAKHAISSNFGDRLEEYIKTPELWESAFWGLVGGVVFQGAGTGVNKVRSAITVNKELNERIKKGEQIEKPSIWSLMNISDVNRQVEGLQFRLADEQTFRKTLTDIVQNNINPYVKSDNIEDKKITNDAEKELIIQRLLDERRNTLVLNALDYGTIDLLKSYLKNDKVSNGLGEILGLNKEQIAELKTTDLAAIEKLEKLYNDEMKKLNNVAKFVYDDDGNPVLMEQLQLIARQNIDKRLHLETLHKHKEHILSKISDLTIIKDYDTDIQILPDIDYKSKIALNYLTYERIKLKQEYDRIKHTKTDNGLDELSKNQQLKNLDEQLNKLDEAIISLNEEDELTNLLYSIQNSIINETTVGGVALIDTDNKIYKTISEISKRVSIDGNDLTDIDKTFFESLDKRFSDITSADLYKLEKLTIDIRQIDNLLNKKDKPNPTSENSIEELDKMFENSELYNAYLQLATVNHAIFNTENDLYDRLSKIKDKIKFDQTFAKLLKNEMVKNLPNVIKQLYDKYGREKLYNIINSYIEHETINYEGIDNEDIEQFKNMFKLLDTDDGVKEHLLSTIDIIIKTHELELAASIISKSENEKDDTNNENLEQSKRLNERETPMNDAENSSKFNAYTLFKELGIATKDYLLDNKNNTFTLQIPNKNKIPSDKLTDYHSFLRNKNIFNHEDDVDVTKPNITIQDPIIDSSGNVIRKGVIKPKITKQDNEITFSIGEKEYAPDDATNILLSQSYEEENDKASIIADQFKEKVLASKRQGSIDWAPIVEYLNNEHIDDPNYKNTIRAQIKSLLPRVQSVEQINVESLNKYLSEKLDDNNSEEAYVETPIEKTINDIVYSSITENKSKLDELITDLFKEIEKQLGYKPYVIIDGKPYINIESIAIYCKNNMNNVPETLKQLNLNNLIDIIINTYKANNNVVITDDITNIDTIKQNVALNVIQDTEKLGILFKRTILDEIEHSYDKDVTIKEYNELFSKIQIGDKVITKIEKDNKVIKFYITKDNNTCLIGALPIPSVDSSTQALFQYNDNWKTDIIIENGKIKSKLKDLFRKWFDSDVDKHTSLNAILTEFKNTKDDKSRNELIEQFSQLKEIKECIKTGYAKVDTKSDYYTLLKGLIKIRDYKSNVHSHNLKLQKSIDEQTDYLDDWFEKVKNSFDFIENIKQNKNANIIIDYINDGNDIKDTEQLVDIKDAIGSTHKDTFTIGVKKRFENSYIDLQRPINGNKKITISDFNDNLLAGATVVLIPNRNNTYLMTSVHAKPLNQITELQNLILDAVANIINLENDTELSDEQINNLENLFRNLFQNRKGNNINTILYKNTLLYYKVNKDEGNTLMIQDNYYKSGFKNGFTIYYKNIQYYITSNSIKNGSNDYNMSKADLMNLIKTILNDKNTKFNLNHDFFGNSDVEIKIGDVTFNSNNFLDKIIEYNAVQVSTRPTEDGLSNFTRITDNPNSHQEIRVKVEFNNDSNIIKQNKVTENNDKTIPLSDLGKLDDFTSSLYGILNNKQIKSKGKHIAIKLFSDIENITLIEHLLPKNIKFVDDYIKHNLITNVSNDEARTYKYNNKTFIIEPNQVLMGKEWLDLVNKNKKEAITKLIHEQIHLLLSKKTNRKYIEQIREIFNEFKKHVLLDTSRDSPLRNYLYEYDKTRYYENYELNTAGLEEFLIESLTSIELIEYLNKIHYEDNTTTNNKKSIFQKLMQILAKFLGIEITSNSLYEKEFKLLSDILDKKSNPKTKPKDKDEFNDKNKPKDESNNKPDFGSLNEFIYGDPSIENDTENNIKNDENEIENDENEIIPDLPFSSIREGENYAITSLNAFINSVSIEHKTNVENKINNGEYTIYCKN